MKKPWLALIVSIWTVFGLCGSVNAQLRVVVTIKPIYGLVANLMQGVGQPELLLSDYASPHTFQLKPSDHQKLHQADLIIWVGPDLETFLQNTLNRLQPKFGVVTLSSLPNLQLLPIRHGRAWEDTHSHDHDEHDEMADPHLWLSVDNAQTMTMALANKFAKADPEHAAQYKANEKALLTSLTELKQHLQRELKPVQKQAFLAYHDGYQYFEKEFGLNGAGTIVINPQLPLSAKALQDIGKLIKDKNITCIFRETEFNDNTVRQALQHWPIQVVELDPLGAKQNKGPDVYQQTLIALGDGFKTCLQPQKPATTPKNKTAPTH